MQLKGKEFFASACSKWGLELTSEKMSMLEIFVEEILKKTAIFNLISERDRHRIWLRHILDSLALLPLLKQISGFPGKRRFLDIGSGAGFPAIPLKIFINNYFQLCERNRRKQQFLIWIKMKLRLSGMEIFKSSVEKTKNESFDIATERALGKLEHILPLCLSTVKKNGGIFCAWHTEPAILKGKEINKILFQYNAKILNIFSYALPQEEKERHIFVFRRGQCTH